MIIEDRILTEYRTVAVVGASPNPERPSHRVLKYLSQHGYKTIPVNPNVAEVMGIPCQPDLTAIPVQVEVVDVFRSSADVVPIVDEAIKVGAKAIWMQEGIVNEEAADKARKAGLLVVMDKCMRKEHIRLCNASLAQVMEKETGGEQK
ncbi:MAG: CoA-binding protein [Chloroflexi bacterium]|nr:CoA-binding protein [Chloroflexota bacterium]MBM3173667.1 CoA-binding protein [Chloroflexota bacterium]MBM3175559.1 CoA-binding protein [Chloroflexota bacterium]MBM4451734.1 CoA-binding protein [Chloroflexota bacterium]